MSISLTKSAPVIVSAGNDIIVEAYENDIVSAAGTQINAFMQLVQFHNEGDDFGFIITINGVTHLVDYACVNTVTDNKIQYPVRTTETLAEWGNKVLDTLLRDALIVNNFKIKTFVDTYDGFLSIYFEPYETDGSVRMVFYPVSVSVNFYYQSSNYISAVLRENLSLSLNLYIESNASDGSTTIEKVKNSLTPPHVVSISPTKATAHWNLKELVRNEYFGHFDFPLSGTMFFRYILDEYRANIYSKWGDPPTEQNSKFIDTFYILDAKLSDVMIRRMNTENITLADELTNNKKFLTNAPLVKDTDIYEPNKLGFLFQQAYTGAIAKVREYYTNDTTATRDLVTFNVPAYQVVEFNTGFQTIKLDDYTTPGLTPYKWEFWLETSGASYISEIRTYVIDTSFQLYARYWLFKNRYGVYDSFRSTGIISKMLPVKKTFLEQDKELPTIIDRNTTQISEDNTLTIQANSGHINDPNMKAYLVDEFFYSRDVYWLKKSQAYAVTIKEDNPVLNTDGEYNENFDFIGLVPDVDDSMYIDYGIPELPLLGDYNGDFNDDHLI